MDTDRYSKEQISGYNLSLYFLDIYLLLINLLFGGEYAP